MAQLTPEELEGRKEKLNKMFSDSKSNFPSTTDITVPQLQELLSNKDKPVVVVDVRTQDEMAVSMLPGSISTIGYRSGIHTSKLIAKKVDAVNLKGSIVAWTLEGLPLVDASTGSDTKRVHTYGEMWNLVGQGYEAEWFRKPVVVQALLDMIKGFLKKVLPSALYPTWLLGK